VPTFADTLCHPGLIKLGKLQMNKYQGNGIAQGLSLRQEIDFGGVGKYGFEAEAALLFQVPQANALGLLGGGVTELFGVFWKQVLGNDVGVYKRNAPGFQVEAIEGAFASAIPTGQ